MSARVAEGWSLRGIPALILETDVAFALHSGLDAVSAVQHQADGVAVR